MVKHIQQCPICQEPILEPAASLPFCSKRCRVIDLGNWLGGTYRVPAALPGDAFLPDQILEEEEGVEHAS